MKRAAIIIAAALGPFALLYAAISFVTMDVDARQWDETQRGLIAIFGIFGGVGSALGAWMLGRFE